MKKGLAKMTALGLCASMVLSMAGCSGGGGSASTEKAAEKTAGAATEKAVQDGTEGSQEPIELTYWYWEDEQGTIENMLKDKWEAYAGDRIKVNFESVPSSSFHDKLITAISTGTGPDVFICKPMWAPELYGMGGLMNMEDVFEGWEYADEVDDFMLEQMRAGLDKLYLYPRTTIVMYLYCRKSMFEKAGIDYPKTVDEFFDACEKLTVDTDGDGKTDQYGFGMRGGNGVHYMWSSFVFSALKDKDYYDGEGKASLADEKLAEMNQKYIDLYQNGYVPPSAITDGFSEVLTNFKSGVTAMLYHHIASITTIKETFGDDFEVIPVPTGESGQAFGCQEMTGWAINPNSKNLEAAEEFVKWASSPEIHDVRCEKLQQVPFMSSVQALDKYKNDQAYKVSMDNMLSAHTLPVGPEITTYTEEIWAQTFQRALMGELSSMEMLEQLDKCLNGEM